MYVLTYYDRKNGIHGSLDSVAVPELFRACRLADALAKAGFAVRLWKNNKLI